MEKLKKKKRSDIDLKSSDSIKNLDLRMRGRI